MITKQICFDRSVGLEVPWIARGIQKGYPSTMKLNEDLKIRIIAVRENSKGRVFW